MIRLLPLALFALLCGIAAAQQPVTLQKPVPPAAGGADLASAVLSVSARMEQLEFVRGENLTLIGLVRNRGRAAFVVDDYGPYLKNLIQVFVRDADTQRLLRPKIDIEKSAVRSLTVLPGEAKEFRLDLRDVYEFPRHGRFQVTTSISRGDEASATKPFSFTVVEGMEFGSAMHALSSNERRPLRFTLLYWDRNKEEKIFLRVTDPAAEDRIVSFVTLVNVVRVKEPTLAFGDDDTATVVQQVSRDHYTRTRISFARNGAATIVGRDENILSDDAVSEQIATRAVADRLLEADSKRKDNGKGGFFSRHKTRTVQEPKLTSGTDVKTREK